MNKYFPISSGKFISDNRLIELLLCDNMIKIFFKKKLLKEIHNSGLKYPESKLYALDHINLYFYIDSNHRIAMGRFQEISLVNRNSRSEINFVRN
jgi:hypothetical protein